MQIINLGQLILLRSCSFANCDLNRVIFWVTVATCADCATVAVIIVDIHNRNNSYTSPPINTHNRQLNTSPIHLLANDKWYYLPIQYVTVPVVVDGIGPDHLCCQVAVSLSSSDIASGAPERETSSADQFRLPLGSHRESRNRKKPINPWTV